MSAITSVESSIERVCVYRNGALVTRRAAVPPGRAQLAGLPLLYAADSLRVRPARGRIVDLRETCAVDRFGPIGRAATAEELERLADALEELDAEAAALDARTTLYAGLAPANPHGPHLPSPDQLLEMHMTASARLEALEVRRMALRDRRRTLEREMQAAQAIVHADPRPPRFTRGIEFTLEDVDEPTAIEIEYFCAAARWVPTYRLDLSEDRARLRLDAMIAQATGEDWRDVTVHLGTADLDRETALPALQSWRIGAAGPRARPAYRPLPSDLPELFVGYDQAHRGAPAPEPITQVRYEHESIDEDTGSFDLATTSVAPPPPPPAPGGMPQPLADMARPSAPPPAPMMMAPQAKRRGATASFAPPPMRSGGGGGGGPPEVVDQVRDATVQPPGGDPLKRLRFAYLRLVGPEEKARGTLQAVDPLVHLASMLADHDVDDLDLLQRAVDALGEARDRLRESLTPSGTRPTLDSFHHVYAAGGLHDIPTDGFWHRAVVRTDAAPAAVDFRTVPRETRDVFRFCTVDTPDAVPYPAGPMQVYIDGTFRVTAPLDATGGGAPLELNLGLDHGVRVLERQVETRQHDKGLMSHTTHVVHTVSLTLRSVLNQSSEVVIFDRLPVVDDEVKDLEVTLLSSEPALTRTDTDPRGDHLDGGVCWRLTLPARGEAKVIYAYRVSFPAKAELVGGNRRE